MGEILEKINSPLSGAKLNMFFYSNLKDNSIQELVTLSKNIFIGYLNNV